MRKVIIPAIILMGTILAGCGSNDEKTEQDRQRLHAVIQEEKARIDGQLLDARIEFVRLNFGNAEASKYELCHRFPPTVKKNQEICARLNERVKKAEASQPKW